MSALGIALFLVAVALLAAVAKWRTRLVTPSGAVLTMPVSTDDAPPAAPANAYAAPVREVEFVPVDVGATTVLAPPPPAAIEVVLAVPAPEPPPVVILEDEVLGAEPPPEVPAVPEVILSGHGFDREPDHIGLVRPPPAVPRPAPRREGVRAGVGGTNYYLKNDVNYLGIRLKAGKLISSVNYDIAKLTLAGAKLVLATDAGVAAQALALQASSREGQDPTFETASRFDALDDFPAAGGGGLTIVAIDATFSPFVATPNTMIAVDLSLGPVTISIPGLSFGQQVGVKHRGGDITLNALTVQGLLQTLEQAPFNPTGVPTFAPNFVMSGAQATGAAFVWGAAGTSGKLNLF